jgi:D-alanyl-D-alanine carboxypeptidase/D-alanyl-D-alanine-endopeptidase (penicillin-binding protein 4)
MLRIGPRICFLLLAGVLVSAPASAATYRHHVRRHVSHLRPRTLDETVRDILAEPELARAHWGISVVTSQGQPVYSLHAEQLFEPASNAKLFTTAATLALIPADAHWTTRAVTSGVLEPNGVLRGNLVLLGSGDPTISGRQYPWDGRTERPNPPLQALQQMADQVVRSGVHRIDGNIVGDDSWFPHEPYGGNWAWDDLQWDYGAPVSALTVNDNVVFLNVMPSPGSHGRPTNVAWDPDVPYYNLENSLAYTPWDRYARAGIDHPLGSRTIRLFGSINRSGLHDALAIDDPAEFAAIAFRQMLLARGVVITGQAVAWHRQPTDTESFRAEVDQPVVLHRLSLTTIAPPDSGLRVLATHISPPLAEDVTVTNKVSQNLHAELYLRLLGRLEASDGSIAQGARVVHQFALNAGVDPSGFLFFDGSGLSPDDLVAPRAITTLLVYAAHQPWGALYRSTFPIAGVDGTLAARFHDGMVRRVFAKTGTLNEVNSLSGYLIARSGRTLVFSILCNDRQPGNDAARDALDRIVTAIARAN